MRRNIGVADEKQKIVYVIRYADGTHLGNNHARVGRQSALKFESHEAAERRALAIAAVRTWETGLDEFEIDEFIRKGSRRVKNGHRYIIADLEDGDEGVDES